MANIDVKGASLGTQLTDLLMADDMVPGAELTYQLAKLIYLYHPLGKKMAEAPIAMAQSQKRTITVAAGPEERCKEAFEAEWKMITADKLIYSTATQARVYGLSSIALLEKEAVANTALDFKKLADASIVFNVFDPLNTAGSLVMNQDPNSMDFQKHRGIEVAGTAYHRSRAVTLLNEEPVYIAYTNSAFGYVGRSVYQRALFPLKSFINTMVADDMVARKAGLIVAMMKQAGSIINQAMKTFMGVKRSLLKEAETNNVISVGHEDKIESINLENVNNALQASRKDILENVAVAADMPAKLLNSETFAEGFGEGTEDAKHVAGYINRIREWMDPLYDFFDVIVMYRAWNKEFYAAIQNEFPDEFGEVDYTTAFTAWKNSFKAQWPSLLTEPDSEKVKTDDVKLKAIIAMLEVLGTMLDPENKALLVDWAQQNANENEMMFPVPLKLDIDALRRYVPPQPDMGGGGDDATAETAAEEPKPFAQAA